MCLRLFIGILRLFLILPAPIPDEEKKINWKAFIKPFEAPQESVKIKI